jgi:hypothetical protein
MTTIHGHSPKPNWLARRASLLCAAAILLLPALYLGSYWLLLDPGPQYPAPVDLYVIYPPEPKPCLREEYVVGGEGTKLFFRPANRLHRLLDQWWTRMADP